MRKRLLTGITIVLMITSIVYIVWHAYDLSSDYNYATAKLDIKNGTLKIINVGPHKISLKDKEIEKAAARFGFVNIYIEKYSPRQTEKGINDYNELIETYLNLRNGPNWKVKYEREIDSLLKVPSDQSQPGFPN